MPNLVNMFTVRVTNTHAPLHIHKCWLLAVLDNKLDGLSPQKEPLRTQARAVFYSAFISNECGPKTVIYIQSYVT